MSSKWLTINNARLARVEGGHTDGPASEHLLVSDQHSQLESVMICLANGWIPILTGAAATAKSSVVRMLAELTGHRLESLTLTSSSDAGELLGTFELRELGEAVFRIRVDLGTFLRDVALSSEHSLSGWEKISSLRHALEAERPSESSPTDEPDALINDLGSIISEMASDVTPMLPPTTNEAFAEIRRKFELLRRSRASEQEADDDPENGRFEWVDSALVRAVETGAWIVIENANYCDASVLDRLNALFEPNGVLTIGEQGCGDDGRLRTIVPHQDFRVFLTVNPKFGELSLAMRLVQTLCCMY
jgi:midasin